jgi:hypothetical protein
VTIFRADAATGLLTLTQTLTDIPQAVSIVFVPVKR